LPLPTPLGIYLYTHGISSERFARMMADALEMETFPVSTVDKWRTGDRMPNSINMRAIKDLTGITADQMLEAQRGNGVDEEGT
jgi:hypothetical protein